MKRSLALLSALALCFALTACDGQDSGSDAVQTPAAAPQNTVQPEPAQPPSSPDDVTDSSGEDEAAANSRILVAYFSYAENAALEPDVDASSSASIQYRQGGALTGNTGLVAGMIAEAVDGQLFSILTTEQYPDNYNDTTDTGKAEQNADIRPELRSHIDNLESYDTIFLGYPCWWGDMPMALYSFLDEYDFSGKTIIPFITSGGSGFCSTIEAIENAEPDAEVLNGLALSANRADQSERDVTDWLTQLGFVG